MSGWDWIKALAAVGFTALGLAVGYVAAGGLEDAGAHSHGPASASDAAAADDAEHDDHVELSEVAQANLGIVVAPVVPGQFTRTRRMSAVITTPPESRAPLFAPIGGRIRAIKTRTGHLVRSGEVVAELVREPIARPALTLTKDLLAPGHERHEAVIALRRATGELRIAKAELARVEEFTRGGDGELPVMPRERAIQLRYALERTQLDYDHAAHELERHGLTEPEVQSVANGEPLPEITAEGWRRALEHNGLWSAAATELENALPEAQRKRPWVVATIAELAARGVDAEALATWFAANPAAAGHLLPIGVMLLDGASLADVDRLQAAHAFDPVVPIRAPMTAQWFSVEEVHARAGALVEAGAPIIELSAPQDLWLQVEPVGVEMPDLVAALTEKRRCRAEPLIEGDGTPLDVTIDYLDSRNANTFAIARVENSTLADVADGSFRSWVLRAGQRYTLHVPTATLDDVVVLPIGALATDASRSIVFVRDDDHFEPVEVRILARDADRVVIPATGNGSLAAGTPVVREGALALQIALSARAGGGGHGHSH